MREAFKSYLLSVLLLYIKKPTVNSAFSMISHFHAFRFNDFHKST